MLIKRPLYNAFGDSILFSAKTPFGLDVFTAGIVLTIMIIPIMNELAILQLSYLHDIFRLQNPGFIRASTKTEYTFWRFGRYPYDIIDTIEMLRHVLDCDKTAVMEMSYIVRRILELSPIFAYEG